MTPTTSPCGTSKSMSCKAQKNSADVAMCCSFTSRSVAWRDRKSTRLNSSHGYISYAVFCLKKKKKILTCQHSIVILLNILHVRQSYTLVLCKPPLLYRFVYHHCITASSFRESFQ